ncbi:hypothetical protein KP509_09G099000 [Ceratopteris richardii]|uniref:F-box domain-containing protein n=1 Tax=Ceratopteris richardii TaxID=49495 RepID=A0A8T2U942_CERRI|nr:hypothetical protein KP509_09G099000 [Ceratopteris richardii]
MADVAKESILALSEPDMDCRCPRLPSDLQREVARWLPWPKLWELKAVNKEWRSFLSNESFLEKLWLGPPEGEQCLVFCIYTPEASSTFTMSFTVFIYVPTLERVYTLLQVYYVNRPSKALFLEKVLLNKKDFPAGEDLPFSWSEEQYPLHSFVSNSKGFGAQYCACSRDLFCFILQRCSCCARTGVFHVLERWTLICLCNLVTGAIASVPLPPGHLLNVLDHDGSIVGKRLFQKVSLFHEEEQRNPHCKSQNRGFYIVLISKNMEMLVYRQKSNTWELVNPPDHDVFSLPQRSLHSKPSERKAVLDSPLLFAVGADTNALLSYSLKSRDWNVITTSMYPFRRTKSLSSEPLVISTSKIFIIQWSRPSARGMSQKSLVNLHSILELKELTYELRRVFLIDSTVNPTTSYIATISHTLFPHVHLNDSTSTEPVQRGEKCSNFSFSPDLQFTGIWEPSSSYA